jgi:alpha-beta hydrolase superfamily lysophospholipase
MKKLWEHLRTSSTFYASRKWHHPRALARRLINYYLLICIALFLLQNDLLFPRWLAGTVMSKDDGISKAAAVGLVPWTHPTSEASSPQGFVRPDFARPEQRGTIIVFHGNGYLSFNLGFYVDAFTQRGFRTFLYEYPGYGGRPGSPSAASIITDARTLIRSLDQAGLGPVYIWGQSIGAGVAAAVCADPTLPVHGLTLVTPWDSLTHAAAVHYPFAPIAVLLWDKYDSIANLQNFPHPICVICGTKDPVIPLPLGLNLYTHLSGPKKLILQDGYGHGDWPSSPDLTWWDDALNFIAPQNNPLTR